MAVVDEFRASNGVHIIVRDDLAVYPGDPEYDRRIAARMRATRDILEDWARRHPGETWVNPEETAGATV